MRDLADLTACLSLPLAHPIRRHSDSHQNDPNAAASLTTTAVSPGKALIKPKPRKAIAGGK